MRKISSLSSSSSATMSLLISTVAIGSMNRLAPVVDAPWTMPGIAALCSARTIRTKRPCRLVTTWSWRYLAVSRPLANWSSVVRSLARCRRSRSRIDARAGLASSTTSPLTSTARRTADTSSANGARRATRRCRMGKFPDARVTAVCASAIEATKSARMRSCSASSGRPSTPSPSSAAASPAPARSGKTPCCCDVTGGLSGRRQRLGNDGAIGLRLFGQHPRLADRRQREARQGLDDAVELEGRRTGEHAAS